MIDVNLIGAPAFAVKRVGDDFVYTGVNRRMASLTGLDARRMIGLTPQCCLPAEIAEAVMARYRQCVGDRQAIDSETHYELPGGERWWHVTVTPVLGEDGDVSSLVGVATDVTGRKTAERDRREADARMALAMDVLDGGFWHLDLASGDVELTSKLATLMAGRAVDRMSWGEFIAPIHPDDLAGVDLRPLLAGECDISTTEYRVLSDAEGGPRWFRSRRRLLRGEAGGPESVIGVAIDITEQRRLQDVYERQATTDSLTGLDNRRGFDAGAERFMRAAGQDGRRFGLIVLDLDRFKPINDRHGHAVGDLVLREVAARLRRQVRPDDAVARLGGDEFAILVAEVGGDDLPHLAQRLMQAAQQPVRTPVGDLSVGVSLGVAVSVETDRSIEDLAARADRALYDVKLSGRGAWKIAA